MEEAIDDAKDELELEIGGVEDDLQELAGKFQGQVASLKRSYAVSKYQTELMAHVGTIYDGSDGHFYIPYYGSDTTPNETIGNDIICRLAKVSQYNPHDVTVIDVLKKGDTVGTFTQSSDYAPYDPNIVIDGGTIRYIMAITSSALSNAPGLGYRDIDKDTLTLGNSVNWCQIKYAIGGTTYTEDATKANLGKMIDRYFGQQSGGTIGLYPIITAPFVEYNGEIYGYLSGLDAGKNSTDKDWSGAIVKSADYGITWEVVAWANDLFDARVDYPMWEAGIAIDSGIIYVLFKFADTPIASYNLTTQQWTPLVYLYGYLGQDVTIDNSRPCLFLNGGKLYAMQNVLPRLVTEIGTVYRSRVKIFRLNPSDFSKEASCEITNDAGVQYMTCINQRGRNWFCFTEDRSHRNYQMKGNISIIPLDFLP